MLKKGYIEAQTIGGFTQYINTARERELIESLSLLEQEKLTQLSMQDGNLKEALASMGKVRDFLSAPQNILGSELTKHGEVAEHMEVGITNARNLVQGLEATSTFQGVGRTAPEDYIKAGIAVQSKFINSPNGTLNAVIDHMGKYDYFGRDSSYYEIPKDYYEILAEVHKGNSIPDMKLSSYENLKNKILEIEKLTGKDFNEVVKPGVSTYREVQLRTAYRSLDTHEKDIVNTDSQMREKIEKNNQENKTATESKHSPNMGESFKVAGISAGISGGISLAMSIYEKRKSKNISDFTEEEWKEIGVETGKSSAKGAVTGFSVYHMTNYAKIPAPVASAYVSAAFGMGKLLKQYHSGEINFEKFVMHSEVVCCESAIVTMGAVVGQALIPIPVLGSLIGSFTAGMIASICKNKLNEKEQMFLNSLREEYSSSMKKIGVLYENAMREIFEKYSVLDNLSNLAFSNEYNEMERFHFSKKLAIAHGVTEFKVLRNSEDVDDYFTV